MGNDQGHTAEEGTSVFKSACRMCHGGCGVLVHVQDGKVVKIKGDPSSPLNKGRMCVKGLSSIEHLYNPKRSTHPLKRAGMRGEGKWERISWDEALDTIAGKIKQIRGEYGIESVAVGTGTGRHHFYHVLRFANALGTPNCLQTVRAVGLLPAVTGNIDIPGGWILGNHTNNGPPYDPALGTYQLRAMLCRVYKAG